MTSARSSLSFPYAPPNFRLAREMIIGLADRLVLPQLTNIGGVS